MWTQPSLSPKLVLLHGPIWKIMICEAWYTQMPHRVVERPNEKQGEATKHLSEGIKHTLSRNNGSHTLICGFSLGEVTDHFILIELTHRHNTHSHATLAHIN
jgi:hypothetical protein